ncbi:MAG: nucleotidyltransferase domain-containing protein [Candidatus Aenigmarchaeota archaeon]|nr:nucleotidyltransferase domain-containing protein [Candidatus Aenigmarchaeota archaeon]
MNTRKSSVLQQDILRLLFTYPEKSFTGRAMALAIGVSQPGISKAVAGLIKESFVTSSKDKETKRLSIALNRSNNLIIGLKRADNLKKVYESGIQNFLEEELPGAAIILFGSFSRGDDISTSDIDIAVIGRKEKDINLEPYENVLHRKVILQFYTSMGAVHKELRENLCNGIVLAGGVRL